MFLNFFKSSFFSQYLVIGIIGGLLWTNSFILPQTIPYPDGPVPLYQLLFSRLFDFRLLCTILGFILVMTETYFLTSMFSRHELVLKNSSLPALIFIVLMSFLPEQLTLTPVNISVGFVIIILYHLLIYYNKPEHLDRVFISGFFVSVGSMFYLPFFLWFVFVIISLLVCRAANWRAWMAAFIGLVTPYIYLVVWFFWQDGLPEAMNSYIAFFSHIVLLQNQFNTDFYVLGGFTLILALWGVMFYGKGSDKIVETRAKSNVVLWTLFFVIISFLYARSLTVYNVILAIPALTMVITRTLTGIKKIRFAEIMLLTYFLMILINNLVIHSLRLN